MKGGENLDKAILEQRTLQIRDVSTDDDAMKVAGYVNKNSSVSEVLSEDGVVFQETILPQAFTNALAKNDEICFYLEHDPNKILATTKNGTLEVTQDDTGLHMSATIVPTTDGVNAYKLIKSGIITNMSFGFLVNEDSWDTDGNIPLRTVVDLDLLEVSAVKNPAYTSSTISARSKNEKLLDKSKINFRNEGGVKSMELRNFTKEELEQELRSRFEGLKQVAKRDAEPTSDTDTSQPNNGRLTDQDWKELFCGCMEMCNIMCESMLGALPAGSFQQVETDSMKGMDMNKRAKDEKRDDATMDSGDDVETDSKNPAQVKGDTDNDGIGEERDDGDDDDVETDSKEAPKDEKRDDGEDDDVETDSKESEKSEKRDDDDSDDSDDSDDDTETDSKDTPKGEKRSMDDEMKSVMDKMADLLKPLD